MKKRTWKTSKNMAFHFIWPNMLLQNPNRVILEDVRHRQHEKRYYCIGKVEGGILPVRFTFRKKTIRIFGAGYWRKGKKIYEQ